jgi:hypothetical protein
VYQSWRAKEPRCFKGIARSLGGGRSANVRLGEGGREASRGKDSDRELKNEEVGTIMRPTSGRGFYDPHSEMNRLFEEMFGGGLSSRRAGGQHRGQEGVAEWAPAIDVVQKDDDLVVRAELPGARPEDVEITVHQGV